MALVHKTLLGLVCAGRARGVEAELVAVLALLFELLGIAADDDDNVWKDGQISIHIRAQTEDHVPTCQITSRQEMAKIILTEVDEPLNYDENSVGNLLVCGRVGSRAGLDIIIRRADQLVVEGCIE